MILVTGGTGLVGAHLLLQLTEAGNTVRALYRNDSGRAKTKNLFSHFGKPSLCDSIEWISGDITDIPSLEVAFTGITHVYHCAAMISYDPRDEEQLRKVNIEGTANIVNCCLAHGVKKLCHVSSIAALGDPREGVNTITEETEWNPEVRHHDYAITKHGAEMEVWRGWQEGLEVVMVNPALIFGYGFWNQGSGAIFTAIDKGQNFYTNGNCGVVAATDVAAIMIQLMESEISGERFTIVAGHMTFKELFYTVADGMHKKRPSVQATRLMTSVAWRLDWLLSKLLGRKRQITRSIARASHKQTFFDTAKIQQALGYEFRKPEEFVQQIAKEYPKK